MQRKPKQFATRLTIGFVASILVVATGCQHSLFRDQPGSLGLFKRRPDFNTLLSASQTKTSPNQTLEDRLAAIGIDNTAIRVNESMSPVESTVALHPTRLRTNGLTETQNSQTRNGQPAGAQQTLASQSQNVQPPSNLARPFSQSQLSGNPTVRAQGGDWGSTPQDDKVEHAGGGQADDSSNVRLAQYPELATPDRVMPPGNGLPSPNVGSPNELNPLVQPYERGGNGWTPQNYADLDVYVTETQTGRINFGGAYNSDNGIVGQFTIDEKNFDITRWPRNFREIVDGTAWRGAGQQFRLELVPGANLERYLVSFTEPYMLGTDYSFSASG